jgi:hypothetical protein
LTPELGAHATEIPLWMFDARACGLMELADEPTVDVEALRELNTLLRHACGPSDAAVPMLQAEHRSLSSAGGAHAIDSEAAARAIQLALFRASRNEPSWNSVPLEVQQQLLRLLSRMLRDHVVRRRGDPTLQEDCDE